MPKCIHCEEVYGDHLRRCPYCGQQQDGAGLGAAAAGGKAPGKVRLGDPTRLRILAYLAVLLVVGGAGVVFFGLPKESESNEGVFIPPTRTHTRTRKDPVKPPPLEEAMLVERAQQVGEEIVVEGRCKPEAIVRILVGDRPALLAPRGDRFTAHVPGGASEVEVVGFDVEGKPIKLKVSVAAAATDRGPAKRAEILNMAEGQTVQGVRVRLKTGPTTSDTQDVELFGIVNRVAVGDGVMTLYRAPLGLVFLRRMDTGNYSFLRELDGQEMVLIPAGLAKRGMGDADPNGPEHIVRLSAYIIDRTEVSCRQYSLFLDHMGRLNDPGLRHTEDPGVDLKPANWLSHRCPEGREDLPVTGVSWYAAYAYARWAHGRLPTEAEWERAAAGSLGWAYPWGDEFKPELCLRGNLTASASMPDGASVYGLLHMSGNAREWCEDRYDPRWYRHAGRSNPRGPSTTRHRVVRGGSFMSEKPTLRAQYRDHVDPRERPLDVGFRVVMRWLLK